MNFLLTIIVLQFFLLASNCQIEDTPHCNFLRTSEILRQTNYGDYYVNLGILNCYGGFKIYEGLFEQNSQDRETEEISFRDSHFHTIPVLTFHVLPTLKKIDLNGADITILEVGCFAGLKNLNILELGGNNIEVLGKGIVSNLPSLTTLNISNNKLHAIHNDSFKDLRNLEELFLNGNNLHFLPDDLFSPLIRIKTINLSRNYLETFNSSTFYKLLQLEYLYINDNKLKYLPPYLFKDLSYLILLDVSYNSLTNISFGVLAGLDRLTHLDISHNQISTFKARNLYFLSNLMELNVEHNNISSLNTDELTIFLPKLKEVYLQGNDWTCDVLLSIIKAFKMTDVQVKPGQNYEGENIIGIKCSDSSTNSSFTSLTSTNNGLSTHEIDNSQFIQYNHLLLEIAGKISDSSKSNQINSENLQKDAIQAISSIISHLPIQNIFNSSERTNDLLENMLQEIRIQRNYITNLKQNDSTLTNDPPRVNGMNPQYSSPNQNTSDSSPNLEILSFMTNIKTELEISRTILDTFMKNTSQTMTSIQANVNALNILQNKSHHQPTLERLERNSSSTNAGNGNVALIVCLFIVVAILITILGIIYIRNNKGNFIANGLRRYRSNRPLGNRSDTDLMTNSRTLSTNS